MDPGVKTVIDTMLLTVKDGVITVLIYVVPSAGAIWATVRIIFLTFRFFRDLSGLDWSLPKFGRQQKLSDGLGVSPYLGDMLMKQQNDEEIKTAWKGQVWD